MALNFNGNTPKEILYNELNVAKLAYNGVVVWMSKELPDGYTQVEYLESTGTQYIDTGLKGNLNTEAIIKVNQITASSQNTITIFGDRTNSSKAIAINLPTNVSNNQQRFGDKSVIYNTPLSLEVDYVLKINKSGLYIDNTKIVTFNTTTEFETESNLQLFKVSGIVGSFYNGTVKIYYCKIYDDGVLVRNFIPCKNPSNVVGLYDTVNDVFYSNAGSGSFIAGAEVEENL